MSDPYEYWEMYDENDFIIKKSNRRAKIDKIAKAKEEFMKVNGRELKTTILPLLAKRAKEARNKREGK